MQNLEHKAITSAVQTTDEDGVVEALVSVTGVKDNVDDIIEPGAYSRTLKERKPKGAWAHEWQTPVSKVREIKELLPGDSALPKTLSNGEPWPEKAGALYVKAEFNLNTTAGKDAFENVKFFGEDCEWSIGYKVPRGGASKDSKTGIRHIKDLNLYEFSPVLFGAASEARSLAPTIKSMQFDMAEDEVEEKTTENEMVDENEEIVPTTEEDVAVTEGNKSDEPTDEELIEVLMSVDEKAEDETRTESKTFELSAVTIEKLEHLQAEIKSILDIALGLSTEEKTEELPTRTVSEAIGDITESDFEFGRKFLFDVIGYERSTEAEKKEAAITLLDSINEELDAADNRSEMLLKTLAKSIGDSYGEKDSTSTESEAKADNPEAEAESVPESKVTLSPEEYAEFKALLG